MKTFKKNKSNFDITFICRNGKNHFAEPILKELKKKYSIQYLNPEHKRDYHHWQVKGGIIWVEWAHKFAKEVAKKKWKEKKIVVRLHRYEIDTPYMDEIKWDNVDKLIFVNPELEGLFKNRVKKQIDTITIPNAIDISKFHYNAPSEENSLLAFSMRYNPVKSYDQLIETFAKIAKINSHIKLTIAAQNSEIVEDNDHYKKCKQLVTKYRLWKNVNLYTIENDSEIFELLKTHNTIVSYSQLESFHYSFAEGLLSGLEGFCNGWRNLNPRFFWNDWCHDNEQDFINAILQWSNSPLEERIEKSQLNRDYVINRFGSEQIANQYEKILFN